MSISLFSNVMEKSHRGNGRSEIQDIEGFTRRTGQFACNASVVSGLNGPRKKKVKWKFGNMLINDLIWLFTPIKLIG